MIIATFETGSFSFQTLATTEADAKKALRKGWLKHCRQYKDADRGLFDEYADEINYVTLNVGDVARDGSVL